MFVPVERIIQTPGFGSIIRYIYPIHESHMLRAHDYQLDSLYALYAQTGRQAPPNDIRLNIAHFFLLIDCIFYTKSQAPRPNPPNKAISSLLLYFVWFFKINGFKINYSKYHNAMSLSTIAKVMISHDVCDWFSMIRNSSSLKMLRVFVYYFNYVWRWFSIPLCCKTGFRGMMLFFCWLASKL